MTSKQAPRVWMIIPTFHPVVGGTQSQVLSLSRRLLADGWDVRVITRQHSIFHPKGLPSEETVDGIPVHRIYSRGGMLGSIRFILGGLWYLFRHGRGQIYHAHDIGTAGWMAVSARYLLRGRAVVKLRTGRMSYNHVYTGRLARWQFGWLLRLAGAVVVVSSEGQQLAQEKGVRPERIIRVANSVDTAYYSPSTPEEKQQLRQQLELPPDKVIVLYVGRFEYIKGTDVLLDAWGQVTDAIRHKAQLVLLGDGSIRDRLQQMVTDQKTTDSVRMLGLKDNVRDYYRAVDMLVLPSRTEGLSNSMVEAMACGLPVLASNVGGGLDFIEDGENGFLFESANVDDLVRKLQQLFDARSRWSAMGQAGRKKAMSQANLDQSVGKFQDVYLSLNHK